MKYILANIQTESPIFETDDLQIALNEIKTNTKSEYRSLGSIRSFIDDCGIYENYGYIIIDTEGCEHLNDIEIDKYGGGSVIFSTLMDNIKCKLRSDKISEILD